MPNNLNVPNTPHNPLLCDTVHRRDHSNALILRNPIFSEAVIPVLVITYATIYRIFVK